MALACFFLLKKEKHLDRKNNNSIFSFCFNLKAISNTNQSCVYVVRGCYGLYFIFYFNLCERRTREHLLNIYIYI
jgi:hypothetical protein